MIEPIENIKAINEFDANSVTCCMGQNLCVLNYTYFNSDVYAYKKSINPIENMTIADGATAYTDSITNTTYILVFHDYLCFWKKLDHNLINPSQVQHY